MIRQHLIWYHITDRIIEYHWLIKVSWGFLLWFLVFFRNINMVRLSERLREGSKRQSISLMQSMKISFNSDSRIFLFILLYLYPIVYHHILGWWDCHHHFMTPLPSGTDDIWHCVCVHECVGTRTCPRRASCFFALAPCPLPTCVKLNSWSVTDVL